jgi:hypothetical protein
LIGFDAREMWRVESRPPEFLLRDDVKRVLSADTTVWPSLFSIRASCLAPAVERMPELDRPDWIGANDPFWEDLGLLEQAVAELDSQEFPYWLIAATWHTDLGFERESREYRKYGAIGPAPHCGPTIPATRDPGWRFLGFDVVDPGTSGLSNCGYTKQERSLLARNYSSCLNQHHLFTDLRKAFEFRTLSNGRVVEHAPFYAIGLWLVRDSAAPE